MANLSIRKLEKATYEQLRIHAAEHGVSMEEKAQQIIYLAVFAQKKISQIFQENFGKTNGIDLILSHTTSCTQ